MDTRQLTTAYFLVIVVSMIMAGRGDYRRVCYIPAWGEDRTGDARFTVADVDPDLCTHIVFSFATLQGGEIHTGRNTDPDRYKALVALKQSATIKVLVAVGGPTASLSDMSAMLGTAETRGRFTASCVAFLRRHSLDGLDLDFEYPGKAPASGPGDKRLFGLLVQELKMAFEAEAEDTASERLLLSVVASAHKAHVDYGYDIQQLIKYTDFINLLTYDYHGGWENYTGHNSPLYEPSPTGVFSTGLNVNYGALYWVRLGVPPEQLNVGMATYGRGFLLRDAAQTGLGAPVSGSSPAQKGTKTPGILSYSEVCRAISDGAIVRRSDEQQVPYFVWGNLWVGFDDEESLKNKVRWLKAVGFGGYMVWDMSMDDHKDLFCGRGPFPLLNALRDELNASNNDPLWPPSYVLKIKCGPCVGQDSGFDCDAENDTVYHECRDDMQVFSNTCPPVSPWFSPKSRQCINLKPKVKCINKCGQSKEGTLLQNLGFLGLVPHPTTTTTTTPAPRRTPSTSAGVRHVTAGQLGRVVIVAILSTISVLQRHFLQI